MCLCQTRSFYQKMSKQSQFHSSVCLYYVRLCLCARARSLKRMQNNTCKLNEKKSCRFWFLAAKRRKETVNQICLMFSFFFLFLQILDSDFAHYSMHKIQFKDIFSHKIQRDYKNRCCMWNQIDCFCYFSLCHSVQ